VLSSTANSVSDKKQWIIKKPVFDRTFITKLQEQTALPLQVVQFLSNRGYVTKELITRQLNPQDHSNFLDYQDGEKFLGVLQSYKEEKILIYGDFDCDGLCAVAVADYGLRKMGYQCLTFVNSRFDDGYGFKEKAVTYALENNCTLILALDHGISDVAAVELAKEKGLGVLIIDHHLPGETLPAADAIVDLWRQDDESIFKSYCSGALTFQFIRALAMKENYDYDFNELLGLTALCTLSDVMELKDANRWYVKEGLKCINEGIMVFSKVFKAKINKEITADDLRFSLAPQINAVGRMTDKTERVLAFFLTNDYQKAEADYLWITEINKKRQLLTQVQLEMARAQIDEQAPLNIIAGDFHEGLVGLIASRIKSETAKVTIVLSKKEEILKGSVRSVDGVDLQEYLQSLEDCLIEYGGHDKAAGIALYEKDLAEFKLRFSEMLKIVTLENVEYLDYVYQTHHIKPELISQWEVLEPCGPGFEAPVFGLLIQDYRCQVLKDTHLKLTTNNLVIMAFNCGKYRDMATSGRPLKALVRFEKDRYNSYQAIVLNEELRYYQD